MNDHTRTQLVSAPVRLWSWVSMSWQALAPVAVGTGMLAGLLLLVGRWGYDDPYITYRYADNVLAGHGLVYNVGERTLSTTSPFYAVLLAGLGLVWNDLPRLGNVLSLLSLVGSAALLTKWARDRSHHEAGILAALLVAFSPSLLQTTGAETCLFVLLLLAGFYAVERAHWLPASAALAMAGMVRPEGLLAGLLLGFVHLVRRRWLPWQAACLYLALVATWYGVLWLAFGSPLPVTLAAKQQQARMQMGTDFAAGFLQVLRQYGRKPLYWLHGGLALLGLYAVAVRARQWLLLLAWTALYLLGYSLIGVSRYFWYYAPLVPAVAVLVAEGTARVVQGLGRLRLPRLAAAGLTGLLVASVLAAPVAGSLALARRSDSRLAIYRAIGEWLQAESPAEATVGALEVGIIGYYAERTMIDFAGLIQPEVAERLHRAGSYEASAAWAIQRYWPDFVVIERPAFTDLAAAGWFRAAYSPVRLTASAGEPWLVLYQHAEPQ